MKILLATRNPGKKREYNHLLQGLYLALVSLDDVGINLRVGETGSTFAENAEIKARAYQRASGLVTLADDSGLEVDALDGAPGVRSARYAGESASDEDRCSRLLRALRATPTKRRTARFRCVIAVAWPDGQIDIADGTCEGLIANQPRGDYGFGYDPVFYLPEYHKTMAELPPEVKNQISHRARAIQAIRGLLERKLDAGNRERA